MQTSAISNVESLAVDRSTFNLTVNHNHKPDDRLREIVNWFTPVNFSAIQADTFAKHSPGTDAWFIQGSKYQQWLSWGGHVLWAKGLPGAGKTILASMIINHLHKHCLSHPQAAVIFAYCRYNDRYTVTDILASFIKQLTQGQPLILPSIESVYNAHQRKETRPSEQELQELLQTLLSSFGRTYLVIDALDEVPDDRRSQLLKALMVLLGFRTSLLFTSRPLQLLESLVPCDTAFVHLEYENSEAIGQFIHQQIEEVPQLRSLLNGKKHVRDEICRKLRQRSEGMYLVATLQIKSLMHSISVNQLRQAVDMLPAGLDALYECTCGRIEAQPETKKTLATKAIIWLTFAYRSLTVVELQHALATSSEGSFDEDDISTVDLITSVCCGLIVVEGESRIVRLVHYTAYDFFRKKCAGPFARPHTFITTACLAYLEAFGFVKKKLHNLKALRAFLSSSPLLDYTYHHWGTHAHECYGEAGLPIDVFKFCEQWNEYPCDDKDIHFDLFKSAHVAAYYGLLDLFPVTNDWCHLATGEYGYTPLILASWQGRTAVVEWLLCRTDVDINGEDIFGETALLKASRHGHDTIVGMLLSRNDIAANLTNSDFQSALIEASSIGHEGVVRWLTSQTDVAMNIQDHWDQTALIKASSYGHEGVVRLLLARNDTAVNVHDYLGHTALIAASRNGHEAVVRLLLSRNDVDINFQRRLGRTALIEASRNGHEAIVELLLSRK